MGFKRILSILNFIVKTNFAIYPMLQYPKTHFSNIPAFHHSNWGEAPNLPLDEALTNRELEILALLPSGCATRRSPKSFSSPLRPSSDTRSTSTVSSTSTTDGRLLIKPTPWVSFPAVDFISKKSLHYYTIMIILIIITIMVREVET